MTANTGIYPALPLPAELHIEILQHFTPEELLNCGLVSKTMFQYSKDNSLWKRHYIDWFSILPARDITDLKNALREEILTIRANIAKGRYTSQLFCDTNSYVSATSQRYISHFIVDNGVLFSRKYNDDFIEWNMQTNAPLYRIEPTRYYNQVQGVNFAGGKFFFGFSHTNDIKILSWDREAQRPLDLGYLEGHDQPVFRSTLVDQTLFSISYDKTVKMWDIESKQLLGTFPIPEVEDFDHIISRDSLFEDTSPCSAPLYTDRKLVIAIPNHGIAVLNIDTEKWNFIRPEKNQFLPALAVFKNTLVFEACDGTIEIWDLQTIELKGSLKGHHQGVSCLTFGNGYLFSAGEDHFSHHSIKAWNIETKELLHEFSEYEHPICALAYEKGKLFSADNGGIIRAYDFRNTSVDESQTKPSNLFSVFEEYCTLF